MHICHSRTFTENTSLTHISAELQDYARAEGSSLYSPILDQRYKIFDNFDEASRYCQDQPTYWNGIVSYRVGDYNKSSAFQKLSAQLTRANDEYREYNSVDRIALLQAAYVTCKTCGSKLSKEYLSKLPKKNTCPLCQTDLRSTTVKNRLETLQAKIDMLSKQLDELKKTLDKKGIIKLLGWIEFNV